MGLIKCIRNIYTVTEELMNDSVRFADSSMTDEG
jgi:hypothetical protein